MKKLISLIKAFLILFDFLLFFLALIFVLFLRFGGDFYSELGNHFLSFLFLSPFVFLLLFAFSLYDIYLLNIKELFLKIFNFLISFLIISSLYFYFTQTVFEISPKTNLFLFMLFFSFLLILSRMIVIKMLGKNKTNIYFLGEKNLEKELEKDLKSINFFEFKGEFKKENLKDNFILIISPNYPLDYKFLNYLKNLNLSFAIFDYISFYEKFFGRIPLSALNAEFTVREIVTSETKIYFYIKRIIDILTSSFIFLFIFFPLFPLISLLIYLNSPGPIFFIQKRVGYRGKIFKLIKFRTMRPALDPHKWATEDTERIFLFGKILRITHLDELPQIFNILKGEISLVGPRPEQPEIAKELESKIKFYDLRYLALPGITGWAQVNYKYPENLEETKIKLEYDLYYIKNSSIFLDILIIIKTLQKVLPIDFFKKMR